MNKLVDVPVPQVQERIVETLKIIPQDRVQQRTEVQTVDSSCSAHREHASNDVVGESPRAKLQRVSSEDRRTPVCGQAVEQSAEMRSALEFFATAQSCRERSLSAYKNDVAKSLCPALVQLDFLRNWKETETYKNDVHLLPTELDEKVAKACAIPCTRYSAHRFFWIFPARKSSKLPR